MRYRFYSYPKLSSEFRAENKVSELSDIEFLESYGRLVGETDSRADARRMQETYYDFKEYSLLDAVSGDILYPSTFAKEDYDKAGGETSLLGLVEASYRFVLEYLTAINLFGGPDIDIADPDLIARIKQESWHLGEHKIDIYSRQKKELERW